MQAVLSLILGGGRGTRLYPLTKLRSKPAVPLAGKYRLIDIPISNCLNSGGKRIYILTQFLSVSLHRHISHTYKFDPFGRAFVEALAAQQTNESTDWYQGTADAVRQQIRYVQEDPCQDVLILSGDQLYRMDFRHLLRTHRESGADVTLAVIPCTAEQTAGFGIMKLDDTGRITGFVEKPKTAEAREPFRTRIAELGTRNAGFRSEFRVPSSELGREYLASMGIYLFKRQALLDMLRDMPKATDFGKDIFPASLKTRHVQGHLFDGYWEDLGTVKDYHAANLALAGDDPPFDFHSPEGVIYTRMRFLPASRVQAAKLRHVLISDGCVIQEGADLHNCVIGVRSRVGRNVVLRDTVLIGADRFETDAERAENLRRGRPNLTVGEGCVIEKAIVDKDCRIGRNVQILNRNGLIDAEGDGYVIRDGIVVIPKGTELPDGTVI